jgi:hypothetical protein
MAEKGAKAKLYDLAFRLYGEGRSLSEIELTLDVSRQTLSAWKAESKRPNYDLDDWDKARKLKRSNVHRLRDLFDRELTALEESRAGEMSAVSLDAITKLGTLVQRWEQAESAPAYDKPQVFLDNLQFIVGWLRENDPEGLKVLAESFDPLTQAFKAGCNGNA